MFPGISPSLGPNGLPEMDDMHGVDITSSTASLDLNPPSMPQQTDQQAPSSPIPPLDLGEPYMRGRREQEKDWMIEEGMSTSSQLPSNGDMLVLDTSKPTPLELYSKPVSSEVVVPDPSNMYYSAPVRLMESDYG